MNTCVFERYLSSGGLILTEGAVYEKLRRSGRVRFDPHLAHAALIYDPDAARVLEDVHRQYMAIGVDAGLAMLTFIDTWRANAERIARSGFKGRDVNADNARFLCRIRDTIRSTQPVFVAGLTGCRGDAYKPEEALSEAAAYDFHAEQINALAGLLRRKE